MASKRAMELAGALIALAQPYGGTGIEAQRQRFADLIDAEQSKLVDKTLRIFFEWMGRAREGDEDDEFLTEAEREADRRYVEHHSKHLKESILTEDE